MRHHHRVVKMDGDWPFLGRVVWLTAEQGGRTSGPPLSMADRDYAHTAYVPPKTSDSGLASFALRNFRSGALISSAEGRWLLVPNEGDQLVEAGTVVVCTEGARAVAYFHVERVVEDQLQSSTVAQQWNKHLRDEFPARLRGEELEGVDLVMLDADTAGCVIAWLGNNGVLDEQQKHSLGAVLRDLDVVLPLLTDPVEAAYYQRLQGLAQVIAGPRSERPSG